MRNLSCKKGQVSGLGMSTMFIVIAGVFLILGLVVLQNLRDTDIISKVNSGSVTNDTITAVSTTAKTLTTCASVTGGNNPTITVVANASKGEQETVGEVVAAGNYTVDEYCGFAIVSGSEYDGATLNVTYTYYYGDVTTWTDTNETLAGLGNFSDFWEIIVLAVVISLVMGLLLIAFGSRARR